MPCPLEPRFILRSAYAARGVFKRLSPALRIIDFRELSARVLKTLFGACYVKPSVFWNGDRCGQF
jgi:hypothetical protein